MNKNVFFSFLLFITGSVGMSINAHNHSQSIPHEIKEINELRKKLTTENLSPKEEEGVHLRIAAISTPQYVEKERFGELLYKKSCEWRDKKNRCEASWFAFSNQDCRDADLLQKELFDLAERFILLGDKAIKTDAYRAWYGK